MRKGLLMILLLVGVISVKAQDDESFTDEDLTKYATVMVWAETETESLKNIVRDSVEIWLEETPLENAKYNELSKADDPSSVESTEEELEAFNAIQQRIDAKKSTFKEVYVTKIKEDIGAGLYNRLKKALKSDEEVKSRYEAIFADLKEVSSESSEDTDD